MAYERFLNMSGAFSVDYSLLLLSYFSVDMRRVVSPVFHSVKLFTFSCSFLSNHKSCRHDAWNTRNGGSCIPTEISLHDHLF